MPCQWRQDAEMRYLHLNYRGVPREEYLELLARSVRMIEDEPPGALMLIEVTGIPTDSAFLSAVKRANHDVFGPRRTHKVYLGADGMRRRIIRGLTLVAPSVQGQVFSTREVALTALRLLQPPSPPGTAQDGPAGSSPEAWLSYDV